MVGLHVAEHTCLIPEQVGEGNIERFQPTPIALEKVETASQDIPPRRHTWRRTQPVVIKNNRPLGKSFYIWRQHPRVSVEWEVVAI
jgi:hypothetical protein